MQNLLIKFGVRPCGGTDVADLRGLVLAVLEMERRAVG